MLLLHDVLESGCLSKIKPSQEIMLCTPYLWDYSGYVIMHVIVLQFPEVVVWGRTIFQIAFSASSSNLKLCKYSVSAFIKQKQNRILIFAVFKQVQRRINLKEFIFNHHAIHSVYCTNLILKFYENFAISFFYLKFQMPICLFT